MSQHQKRDPVDVLHAELLSREGGISAAARAIGRSPGVLHNKFSDAMPHYEISVREALSLAMLSDSTEFVEAVCEQFGGTFLPVQEGAAADGDVLQAFLLVNQRMGELARGFTEARADGVIDAEEFCEFQVLRRRLIASITRFESELKSLVRTVPAAQPLRRVVANG